MSVSSVQGLPFFEPVILTPSAQPPLSKYARFLSAVQGNAFPNTLTTEPDVVHQHFERVDSTQTQARLLVNLFPNDIWAILSAEEQTAGQGTHNRRWISPPHVNMYATFMFSVPKDERIPRLFQVAAIAVARTLQEFGLQPEIKWPNDVLLNKKKACGILCELMTQEDDPSRYVCVAGIGLNVNMEKALCDGLDQPVTSMFVESNKTFSTREVTMRVFHHMQECAKEFCLPGSDLSSFYLEFDKRLAFKGETVSIEPEEDPSHPIIGRFLGVTPQGHLQIDVGGEVRTLSDGRLKPIPTAV